MFARSSALVRRLLAVCFVFAALVRPAAAVDWSDIWWAGQAESGWGVNFINADNFIFATFFVYGPNNQPIWYTAQLTVDANGVWSGPLYLTTGTYFGAPWNTANNSVTQVGSATFNPNTSFSGTFTYNVNNVNVSKQIQRQTLKTIPLGGKYSGAYLSIFSSCSNPANNGPITYYTNLTVTQVVGGTLRLDFESSSQDAPLAFLGTYIQDGLLYRIPNASYTLGQTTVSAQVSEVKATSQGIEGRWTASVNTLYPGCVEQGYFSALFITN